MEYFFQNELNEKNVMRTAKFSASLRGNGAQVIATMPNGEVHPIAWCENHFWTGLNSSGILDGFVVASVLAKLLTISKETQDEMRRTGDLPVLDEPLEIIENDGKIRLV